MEKNVYGMNIFDLTAESNKLLHFLPGFSNVFWGDEGCIVPNNSCNCNFDNYKTGVL